MLRIRCTCSVLVPVFPLLQLRYTLTDNEFKWQNISLFLNCIKLYIIHYILPVVFSWVIKSLLVSSVAVLLFLQITGLKSLISSVWNMLLVFRSMLPPSHYQNKALHLPLLLFFTYSHANVFRSSCTRIAACTECTSCNTHNVYGNTHT